MKGVAQVAIILGLLFFGTVLYGNLAGEATKRIKSSGELIGQHLNYHPERGLTTIEILAERVNEEGVPIIKRGSALEFIVKPGKYGVWTGYEAETLGGFEWKGDHCARGGDGDFCSNSYRCVDENPKRCKSGPKCYGDKLIKMKVPDDQRPRRNIISVCDGSDECSDRRNIQSCVEIKAMFIIE